MSFANVRVTDANGEPLGEWRTGEDGEHLTSERLELKKWFEQHAPQALANANGDEILAARELLEGARRAITVMWNAVLPIAKSAVSVCEALGLDVKGIPKT